MTKMSLLRNYFCSLLVLSILYRTSFAQNPLSEASNEFGINLFNKITAANDGNHVISPLSLTTALGMVHLGAKGERNNELRQVLGYNKYKIADSEAHNVYKTMLQQIRRANSSQYVLNVANRVMAQNDFHILANYRNRLQINYDASIQEVDFARNGENAIKTINQWVADKTRDKITSLFEKPLPIDTRLVIVNAVYFKGKWLNKFRPEHTKEDTFHNNGNTKASVKMMFRANTKYNFIASKELDADILEMPYIGGDISMYILLPRELNGLKKLASTLTEQKLSSAIKSMRHFPLNLFLPKFKIQQSYDLVDNLKRLGLANIFNNSADLSGINGRRNLKVSDVIHKVFLEVNEEGSEAAAVTGFVLKLIKPSLPIPPRDFKVDRPFMFVIRDNRNNQNLFFGQITQL